MPNVNRFAFIFSSLYILFVLFFPPTTYSFNSILFEDNFEDPSLNKWVVPRNTCSDDWEYRDGKYGMAFSRGLCLSESIPSDDYWDPNINDYTIDFDMYIVSGYDKNLAWRYLNQDQWAGVHIQARNPNFQRVVLDEKFRIPINNGEAYHFTISSYGTDQKVYFYNLLNYADVGYLYGHTINPLRLLGRPALQVSDGKNDIGGEWGLTEIWFDNYIVTQENDNLDVPYFSQLDEQWADYELDSIDETIGEVGCALTSATMVLRYHGVNWLPSEVGIGLLDVNSLNRWLSEHDGFDKRGYLKFDAVSTMTKEVADYLRGQGSPFAFDALEYMEINKNDFETIDDVIENDRNPLIFKEKSSSTSTNSHFVVATQVNESEVDYSVLDPYFEERTNFVMPPDQLRSVRYFYPSNTDLSYLTAQVDEGVTITINGPNSYFADQSSNSFPMSFYDFEYPIGGYSGTDAVSGTPGWTFEYKYPESGEYDFTLESDEDGWVDLWVFLVGIDGERKTYKESFFVGSESPTVVRLNFDSENAGDATLERVVDLNTLLSDLQTLDRMGMFKNKGVVISLERILSTAIRFENINGFVSDKLIQVFEKKVNQLTPKLIDEVARDLLLLDLYSI